MQIKFNPSLSISDIHQQYQQQKRFRINQVFAQETIESLRRWVSADLPFEAAFVRQNQNFSVPTQQLKMMPAQERQALIQDIYRHANKGIGFLYERVKLPETDGANKNPIGDALFNWLNSKNTINVIKQITGFEDIRNASAQLTRYVPGNFLTRHNDVNPEEQRRVAYVISFTQRWHPDWGGLLQFFQQDGTPLEAWSPLYNSMSLFDVNHPHSVTYVAPFAPHPRLSVTGWFLARS